MSLLGLFARSRRRQINPDTGSEFPFGLKLSGGKMQISERCEFRADPRKEIFAAAKTPLRRVLAIPQRATAHLALPLLFQLRSMTAMKARSSRQCVTFN